MQGRSSVSLGRLAACAITPEDGAYRPFALAETLGRQYLSDGTRVASWDESGKQEKQNEGVRRDDEDGCKLPS